jgi:hypothetical protein
VRGTRLCRRSAPANILDPVATEATRAKLAVMRDGLPQTSQPEIPHHCAQRLAGSHQYVRLANGIA